MNQNSPPWGWLPSPVHLVSGTSTGSSSSHCKATLLWPFSLMIWWWSSHWRVYYYFKLIVSMYDLVISTNWWSPKGESDFKKSSENQSGESSLEKCPVKLCYDVAGRTNNKDAANFLVWPCVVISRQRLLKGQIAVDRFERSIHWQSFVSRTQRRNSQGE